MLVVQKFGGSSVADAGRIMNVANIIAERCGRGDRVVAVVSAQGDTTDELIEKAKEINPASSKREMDVLLSCGEQMSMSLLAMALEKLGYKAVSLTGWQAGIETSSTYGSARIRKIETERLESELEKNNIVIIAGFQGINKYEDVTTLGRGGSDTTAVAAAAALGAELCQIYTDVEGVYTADPRKIKGAKKLDEISFDEMLELSTLGAQVLLNRSVELAKKYNVNLEVLSSLHRVEGTKVREVTNVEGMLIKGVAKDTNVARITVKGVPDEPGVAFRIFSLLGAKKINVDIILQTARIDNRQSIAFTVPHDHMEQARKTLEENIARIGAEEIDIDEGIAKVSIVGAGMQSHSGVASKMFEALYEANINIQMISTSEIKISVIIDAQDADRAVEAIHDAFIS